MKPVRFYFLALVIAVCDQVSKWAILKTLLVGETRPALGKVMWLTHTHNPGGAFSLFQAGNTMFLLVASFAIVALIYSYHRLKRTDLLVSGALALALGGAVGNLIDRARFGYVVDFFDFHGWTDHNLWPIFNVADSAITVGIFLLAWHFLFSRPVEETESIRQEAGSSERGDLPSTPNAQRPTPDA